MNHNYTILITGNITEADETPPQGNLATFAFADIDPGRIAKLKRLASDGAVVRLDCPSCAMLGRLELVGSGGDVTLFHFVLDELRKGG